MLGGTKSSCSSGEHKCFFTAPGILFVTPCKDIRKGKDGLKFVRTVQWFQSRESWFRIHPKVCIVVRDIQQDSGPI